MKRYMLIVLIFLMTFLAIPFVANATTTYETQVQQMYVAYYGRPGDPGGVDYWAERLEAEGGNWISDLVNAFGTSTEYTDRFGSLSADALIDNLYQQLFNRGPDPVGLSFYIDLLNGTNQSGLNPSLRQSTLAEIALDISNGVQGQDVITLDNKLYVAEYFTESIIETGRSYEADDIPAAVAIISIVDASDESVTDGMAAVDDFMATEPQFRLNMFRGNWLFTYVIVSTWSGLYDIYGTAYESDGEWYLQGSDEYGDIVIATWEIDFGYLLLDSGTTLDNIFSFDFDGADSVSGCYYLDVIDEDCYPMNGTRISSPSASQSVQTVPYPESALVDIESAKWKESQVLPDKIVPAADDTKLKEIVERLRAEVGLRRE